MTAPSAPKGLLTREEIEALVSAATPAPWQLLRVGGDRNVTVYGPSAAIVAKSCGLNDARLLAAVHQLAAQAARAADLAQKLEAANERVHYATGVADLAMKHRDQAEAAFATAQEGMREPFVDVLAALAAAISLLERGGKKAAPSDKMFAIMLDDYRKALDRGRVVARALALPTAAKPEGA